MREAFEMENVRLEGELDKFKQDPYYKGNNYQRYSYKSRGLYGDQIQEIKQNFSADKIKIIDSKNFFKDTENTLREVFSFLGVDSNFNVKTGKICNGGNNSIDPDEEKILTELKAFYKEPNALLYKILDKNLDWD